MKSLGSCTRPGRFSSFARRWHRPRTAVLSLLLPQQLGSLLDETVFDPNTGIIAGLLNARDDLATAVLTANNDFPSTVGSLATAEWANMPELIQATGSTLLTDLATLFNPADFFAP